ncbi:MAG: peroxidase-related enzyme [Saprospiraceae bacterium]|nr:peroxidase-related enzyme [Saprospiraceae bacterium]
MPFIEVIDHQEATGELKKIYDDLVQSRGKLAEVHKIQSLNPPTILAHMDLYIKIMFGKSPLRRHQREMLGVITSAVNKCEYCVHHHAEALNHFWKDNEKIELLIRDFRNASLSGTDLLLCIMAEKLTQDPSFPGRESLLHSLREEGLSDRAILDATLVIAYFNFVNRIVLNLGVEFDVDEMKGYKYD